MRLKHFIVPSLSALLLIPAVSCNRDDNNCSAGSGGNLTIVAYPKHHSNAIINLVTYPDTVFVKFNTQNFPGDQASAYDTFFVGETGEDHVHLPGLKCGDYYLFGAGYDSTIIQRVKGGIPFSTDQESGEISLSIPVTEGD